MKTPFQLKTRLVLALGLAALSASSFAATTVYTSSASFMAALQPGSYTETFTSPSHQPIANYTSGGFSYTLSAPGGLFSSGTFIEATQPGAPLTVTFTSGNVTALGGNFFAADLDTDAFQAAAMTLILSDGTTVNFTPATLASSYRGFTSPAVINSITISAPPSFGASLDNLTVGVSAVPIAAAVPEPETYALMALGLVALGFTQRRRMAKR